MALSVDRRSAIIATRNTDDMKAVKSEPDVDSSQAESPSAPDVRIIVPNSLQNRKRRFINRQARRRCKLRVVEASDTDSDAESVLPNKVSMPTRRKKLTSRLLRRSSGAGISSNNRDSGMTDPGFTGRGRRSSSSDGSSSRASSPEDDPDNPLRGIVPPEMIICSWCQNVGSNQFSLQTNNGERSFCSELCFNKYRRASFKKSKLCDWCKGFRNSADYVDYRDGESKLLFCSETCLNKYKMNIFCKETQAHLELLPNFPELMKHCSSIINHNNNTSSGNSETSKITPDLWLQPTGDSGASVNGKTTKFKQELKDCPSETNKTRKWRVNANGACSPRHGFKMSTPTSNGTMNARVNGHAILQHQTVKKPVQQLQVLPKTFVNPRQLSTTVNLQVDNMVASTGIQPLNLTKVLTPTAIPVVSASAPAEPIGPNPDPPTADASVTGSSCSDPVPNWVKSLAKLGIKPSLSLYVPVPIVVPIPVPVPIFLPIKKEEFVGGILDLSHCSEHQQ